MGREESRISVNVSLVDALTIDVDAEPLLIQLDMSGVRASHGSACSSESIEPSRVLLGMGYSKERARSSLRFSFGRYNTIAEVETALNIIQSLVEQMR